MIPTTITDSIVRGWCSQIVCNNLTNKQTYLHSLGQFKLRSILLGVQEVREQGTELLVTLVLPK